MRSILFALMIAIVGFAGIAPAQPSQPHGRHPRAGGPSGDLPPIFRDLDLTEDQREEVSAVFADMRTEVAPLFQSLNANREELDERMADENPNPTIIGELVLEARTIENQMSAHREATHQQILALLTEEQRAEFEAQTANRPDGPPGRRGGPRGRQPGGPSSERPTVPQNS